MKKTLPTLVASLALCSAASSQAAAAADCLTPAEMHGLIAYFLPNVIGKATEQCRASLPPDSYLVARAPGLANELRAGQAGAWPGAKSAFFKFAGPSDLKELAGLPDEALRPLIDAAIATKFTFAIGPADCAEANDVAEALSPLSAEQTVHLAATIFSAVARKDRKMSSCPREPRR